MTEKDKIEIIDNHFNAVLKALNLEITFKSTNNKPIKKKALIYFKSALCRGVFENEHN